VLLYLLLTEIEDTHGGKCELAVMRAHTEHAEYTTYVSAM